MFLWPWRSVKQIVQAAKALRTVRATHAPTVVLKIQPLTDQTNVQEADLFQEADPTNDPLADFSIHLSIKFVFLGFFFNSAFVCIFNLLNTLNSQCSNEIVFPLIPLFYFKFAHLRKRQNTLTLCALYI
jgi:hypothetical protein